MNRYLGMAIGASGLSVLSHLGGGGRAVPERDDAGARRRAVGTSNRSLEEERARQAHLPPRGQAGPLA